MPLAKCLRMSTFNILRPQEIRSSVQLNIQIYITWFVDAITFTQTNKYKPSGGQVVKRFVLELIYTCLGFNKASDRL